jgi:Leucine-rich repeat (LRR) protein
MVTLDLSSNALEAAAVGPLVAGLKIVQTLVRQTHLTYISSIHTLFSHSSFIYFLSQSLSRNQLTSVPSLAHLPRLATLDVSYNAITLLPPLPRPAPAPAPPRRGVGAAPAAGLQVLNAGYNALVDVSTVTEATALATVNLNDNKVRRHASGPHHCIRTPPLHTHRYRCKPCSHILFTFPPQLSSLPPGLSALTTLKSLNLANNDLADLPAELGFLEALVRISLDGNPLRAVPRSKRVSVHALKFFLKSRAEDQAAAALEAQAPGASASAVSADDAVIRALYDATVNKKVFLGNMSLTHLPDALFNQALLEPLGLWGALAELDLSGNPLSASALEPLAGFPHGGSLQRLVLDGCGLAAVPPAVLGMHNLKKLSISRNKLSLDSFSSWLAQQARGGVIPDVTVAQCGLAGHLSLPAAVMHELDAADNRLLSVDAASVRQLRRLAVPGNKLRNFPRIANYSGMSLESALSSGANGSQLEYLDISNNDIAAVDPLVALDALHPRLTTLLLRGNPQRVIRPGVVNEGSVAVLRALRLRVDAEVAEDPSRVCGARAAGRGAEEEVRQADAGMSRGYSTGMQAPGVYGRDGGSRDAMAPRMPARADVAGGFGAAGGVGMADPRRYNGDRGYTHADAYTNDPRYSHSRQHQGTLNRAVPQPQQPIQPQPQQPLPRRHAAPSSSISNAFDFSQMNSRLPATNSSQKAQNQPGDVTNSSQRAFLANRAKSQGSGSLW